MTWKEVGVTVGVLTLIAGMVVAWKAVETLDRAYCEVRGPNSSVR